MSNKQLCRYEMMTLIIHFGIANLLPFFASVVIDPNEGFLRSGKDPVLTVLSAGHALHVFINSQLSGEEHYTGLRNFMLN